MSEQKRVIVLAQDSDSGWLALYVDGERKAEGEKLDIAPDEVLTAAGIRFDTYVTDLGGDGDGFPRTLDELMMRQVSDD